MDAKLSLFPAAVLLALMALLAAVELWIPFRSPPPGARRRSNLALTAAFFAANLLLTLAVVAAGMALQDEAAPLPGVAAFAIGLLVLDFFGYAVHVLMHKLPWLWRVHRVHHSDVMVDVTTAFRQHPLETVLRFAFTAIPAMALGVPPLAAAAYRLASGINALLEHANIRVAPALDRVLSWLLVTPVVHKIHHSRLQRQTDSNYGNIFSIFDRLLGTWTPAAQAQAVHYGLDEMGERQPEFAELLRLPWETDSVAGRQKDN